MKILIDGRLYGLENAGLGRYLVNLVTELSKIDSKNEYSIFLRRKYFEELKLPVNWKKVLVDFKHYSFREQFLLTKLIEVEKPDLTHFPHFNIPVFYKGKFIVTIHDMLMHKQKGLDATTLNPVLYKIKRLAYRVVFDRAIKKSVSIIVPSFAVKKEIIDFYKISPEKINVIYEG